MLRLLFTFCMLLCLRLHPMYCNPRHYVSHMFMQTYSIDGFWDTDERFIFRGQKVKVHGLSGLKCAGNNIECGVNTPDNTQGHFVLC